MMNSIDKVVATRTLDEATWNNTRLLKGEADGGGRGAEGGGEARTSMCSAAPICSPSLLKAGLVDEYRICLAPVVLGGGNPLFKPQDQQVKMRLESARPLKTGGAVADLCSGRVANGLRTSPIRGSIAGSAVSS